MRSGQKLYQKAKKIIPGGTMLLSKRPEMFLPKNWPSYFSKCKGVEVWDLDGNKFNDMCIMGIGTNTLGYGNEYVDKKVQQVINKGNLSTLNCPEEVGLAEKLIADAEEEAKNKSEKMVDAAKTAIENEKNAAMSELRKTVVELSVGIAEKVISEELDDKNKQLKIIEDMLEDSKLKS